MIKAEKRDVTKTGAAYLGWRLGHGAVYQNVTIKKSVWCVVAGSKVIAECRSEKSAVEIAMALNK